MTGIRTEGPLGRTYLEVTLAVLALVTIVAFESMAVSTAMPVVARELDAVRAMRPRLRSLLLAGRDHAVELVNEMLAEVRLRPRLVRHEEYDWHLHAVDQDDPLVDRITIETAMAMVDVIRADEMSRLGVCADETCDGLVLDLSRNRSRRYCSTTCGNRNSVAAYRARQAAGG